MVKSEEVQQHRGVVAGRELLQLWGVICVISNSLYSWKGRLTLYLNSNAQFVIGNFALLAMTVAHKEPEFGFATRAIHVGSQPDPATGAVIPSV